MKRALLIFLLVVACALLSAQVVLADTHVITHDDIVAGTPATINVGDSATFEFFWYAGTPGLVREFIRCSQVTLQITQGDVGWFLAAAPETDACWDAIQRATPEFISSSFTWANDHAKTPVSLAYWRMPLPVEEWPAGDYILSWELGWDHPTIDLGDWDGDGRIDHYPAGALGGGIELHIVP